MPGRDHDPGGGALPAGEDRALEALGDEGLDLGGVIGGEQRLDPGLILVSLAHGDQVDVGALRILAQDSRGRLDLGVDGVVGVDRGGGDVGERARRLGGLDLDDLQLLRVADDVVSSSVVPFSSCPQSLPASESFPMSQLFA